MNHTLSNPHHRFLSVGSVCRDSHAFLFIPTCQCFNQLLLSLNKCKRDTLYFMLTICVNQSNFIFSFFWRYLWFCPAFWQIHVANRRCTCAGVDTSPGCPHQRGVVFHRNSKHPHTEALDCPERKTEVVQQVLLQLQSQKCTEGKIEEICLLWHEMAGEVRLKENPRWGGL